MKLEQIQKEKHEERKQKERDVYGKDSDKEPEKKLTSGTDKEREVCLCDPFMGVGTTGLKLNRRVIGMDIDESYFVTANDRMRTTMMSLK